MSPDKNLEDSFVREGGEILKQYGPKIVQIWKQLGFPPNKIEERFRAALSHHRELWESMLEEEQNNRKKIISAIDRLGRQYHQLCKELGTQCREFSEDLPLLETEKQLQETLSALVKEKEERMKAVRALFKEEDNLCNRLGMEVSSINRDRIPTSEQFQMLQDRITSLKTELVKRQAQYVSLRDAIRHSMQQLEMSARSSFEVDLFVTEPSNASLFDSDMDKIKELKKGLDERLEHNQKKAESLRSTIETLWERLSVEPDMREMFLMENRGFAPSTIQKLERERSRLEELKRQNIERFIQAVRKDLEGWWDRCYVSEAERRNFTPFFTDVYTEELLEVHERQVEKYKHLHNDNKEIFLKVHHRENLWKRMEDIEKRGKDPSRLFGNRGCALLQEEKERKKIIKELPRVEEQLTAMLTNYERSHGQVLLINGMDYRDMVKEQWAIYEESKENEKLQRQKDRAEKLVEEAKGGAKPTTPIKRRLGTTALRTQLESPKAKQRKLLAPSTAPQQRPTRRILTEATINHFPNANGHDIHDASMMSTYSAFTKTLRQKAESDKCVNSTVLMEYNARAVSSTGTPSCSSGSSRTAQQPSTLPRRRSPRLAPLTPCQSSTPVSNGHSMMRRSKTQSTMAAPMSAARITPSRSTPRLTMTKHPRPFLI